jgi:hypothetical protein
VKSRFITIEGNRTTAFTPYAYAEVLRSQQLPPTDFHPVPTKEMTEGFTEIAIPLIPLGGIDVAAGVSGAGTAPGKKGTAKRVRPGKYGRMKWPI